MSKKCMKGIVSNVSTYPLPTLRPRKADNKSKTLTFDVNFNLISEEGESIHVWFHRGFRFPPPLEDGDYVEVYGRFGQLMGLITKSTFFAAQIVDNKRSRIYTSLRNKKIKRNKAPQLGEVF